MKRMVVLLFFITVFLACFVFPVQASGQILNEPWGIYEDWRSGLIRASHWKGVDDPALEINREIKGVWIPYIRGFMLGGLVMRYRFAGSTASDTNYSSGFNRMRLGNPVQVSQINQFAADFKILKYTIKGVSGNPTPSANRPAAINLSKFNDGTSSGPGDMTGDCGVRVRVYRFSNSSDPPGLFRVQAWVFRCRDAGCTAADTPVDLPNIATVEAGKWFTLRAVWDEPNDRFLVGVNNEPDVVLSYNAVLNNVKPAVQPAADIRMQGVAANWTGGAGETDAEVVVGRVRVNQSALLP
jgi:hypothetical protein